MGTLLGPELEQVREALVDATLRCGQLLRRVADPSRHAIGSWDVGETAAHLASSAPYFLAVARGEVVPEALEDVAATNAAMLAADPERDPRVLAARFLGGKAALLRYVDRAEGDPEIELFRDVKAPLSTLLAAELGEVLVHGYDIGRASHLPWRIPAQEAAVCLGGMLPLLPPSVDRGAAAGLRARFDLRIRGGVRVVLGFDDGRLELEAPSGDPVDCHLSADPVDFLLLTFGRIRPAASALRGHLAVWGRHPTLAARFPSLFRVV